MDAFADEYGNTSIKTGSRGVTDYFVVTAVLVPDDLVHVRSEAESIRRHNFQAGEMKSSRVGDDDGRRIKILSQLVTLPIKTYSLAVDKRAVHKDSGLSFKRTFFKHINRKLYARLFNAYGELRLIADEHGTEQFMLSFKDYFERSNFTPDFFFERSFRFENSANEVMLQVADFVSGTLARCIDPIAQSPRAKELAEFLSTISLGVETWPPKVLPFSRGEEDFQHDSPHDEEIRDYCFRQAVRFLAENNNADASNAGLCAQLETLKFLIFKAQFGDDRKFTSTSEIIKHLKDAAGLDMTAHQIRSAVVAKLRDAKVIVASSSGKKGYKLPVRQSDVAEFLLHTQSIVPPMLARVRLARDDLHLATRGKLDILEDHRFKELQVLLGREHLVVESTG